MPAKRRVLLLLSAYDPQTHQAAVAAARRHHWHLDTNMLTPLRMIDQWQGDGILCSLGKDRHHVNFVRKAKLPSVDLSTWRTDIPMPRVSVDNHAIGRLAAEHFLSCAHRNFAWYSSQTTPYGEARRQGFEAALRDEGFVSRRLDARGSQNTGAMIQRIHRLPRPCAIFSQNDADAGWLSHLCQSAGYRVPLDFALLGTDNNPLVCEVQSVPLSSIDKDARSVTAEGASQLQAAMDGKRIAHSVTYIPPKGIVVRTSSDVFAVEDDLVREALSLISQNLAAKTGTPEIAMRLGVSRSKLNQRFQASMQQSLHQTLMSMRLRKASELLTATTWSVERIARATGFTHAPHLSNSFKKHFGHSPLRHRMRASNG